jgi:hypothetical protein
VAHGPAGVRLARAPLRRPAGDGSELAFQRRNAMSLVGPIGRITERLELWRKSPATTLLVTGARDEPTLRAIRDALAAGG